MRRRTNAKAAVVILTVTAFLAVGLLRAQTAEPQKAKTQEKDLALFYQENCAGCHGADGAGMGADGKKLKGPDLTDAKWLKKTTDEKIAKVILKGKFFGMAMPKYADRLTKAEALRMAADVIRTAKKGQVIGPQKRAEQE